MGGAASVESQPEGPIVSVDEAREIMARVFSRQITHAQLRAFLGSVNRDFLGDDVIQQILSVLDDSQARSQPSQSQDPTQQQQISVEEAGSDLPSAVRNTFFGQFESVKQAFAAADVNGGGTISHQEFADCVRRAGLVITDDEILAAAAAIDTDHDGSINYSEFLQFLVNADAPDELSTNVAYGIAASLRVQIYERYKSMRQAFLAMDPDGSGCVDTSEVQQLLQGQNFSYSDEDINLFVASFPHEKEGGFSYVEFCKMVEGEQPFTGM